MIPCYALRKEFNLPISSNPVEKDNDLNVAVRQKHNGMAWSTDGSGALSAIATAEMNLELESWIFGNGISFEAHDCKKAA